MALIALHSALAVLAPHFDYGTSPGNKITFWLLVAELLACFLYLVHILLIRILRIRSAPLWWIVIAGCILRLTLFFVNPVKANDYYRYLWDGALTAHGVSPYLYAPQQVRDDLGEAKPDTPLPVRNLADKSGSVIKRVNHPELRTIYPPVAQGLFALACRIAPFEVFGWRLALFLMDGTILVFLARFLRIHQLPPSFLAIYWWNPLLIFQTYAKCHLDLAAAGFILFFAISLAHRRIILAAVMLAGAVGMKIWPLLLLPFLLFSRNIPFFRRILTFFVFFILLAVIFAFFYPALQHPESSGTLAYAQKWQNNSGIFYFFDRFASLTTKFLLLDIHSAAAARGLFLLFAGVGSIFLAVRKTGNALMLFWRIGMAIMLILLLSPVLYPWYYIPVIPLAAVFPSPVLLIWTLLLQFIYMPSAFIPSLIIPWLVHAPLWLVLIAGGIRHARRNNLGVDKDASDEL